VTFVSPFIRVCLNGLYNVRDGLYMLLPLIGISVDGLVQSTKNRELFRVWGSTKTDERCPISLLGPSVPQRKISATHCKEREYLHSTGHVVRLFATAKPAPTSSPPPCGQLVATLHPARPSASPICPARHLVLPLYAYVIPTLLLLPMRRKMGMTVKPCRRKIIQQKRKIEFCPISSTRNCTIYLSLAI
jgi:hypothetical protein